MTGISSVVNEAETPRDVSCPLHMLSAVHDYGITILAFRGRTTFSAFFTRTAFSTTLTTLSSIALSITFILSSVTLPSSIKT